jgi:tetratricopeptide (TPR) repeat protein
MGALGRPVRLIHHAAALALAGAVLYAASEPVPSGPPAGDSARRIALFGIDAADWREIDALTARGRLPAFTRLERVSARGVLQAGAPLLSPIIWTTIATGRAPEDHGVLDFMVDLPGGGQAPVGGGARLTKAMWEIWSDAGRRVLVTGWWATWPADEVTGIVASDRLLAPQLNDASRPATGLVHPEALFKAISGMVVAPGDVTDEEIRRMTSASPANLARAAADGRSSSAAMYANRFAHFRSAVADARTVRILSTALVRNAQPDLWAAYYEIVDTASHLFVRDGAAGARAIAAAYEEVDQALAETARVLDPDTLLIVVSDHGFQPADAGIAEDPADLASGATAWHRPYGIIAVSTAGALAGTRSPPEIGRIGTVSPLDVLPTMLARAGLPVAADMPGRLVPALAPSSPPARIASYGGHRLPRVVTSLSPAAAAAERERLRSLGYVSGAEATTSLARVNLGEILARKGDVRGAIRELEPVVRQDPLNERAVMWLARGYVSAGRRDEAVAVYDQLIRGTGATLRRLDPLVVLAATDLDVEAGRVAAASERLARIPSAIRNAPEVLVARGAVAQAKGQAAVAEREYRAALDTAPSDRTALSRLVDVWLRSSRVADAVAVTSRLARRFPSSVEHQSMAGEAALAARQYRDAERAFVAALVLAPDAVPVRLDLARSRLLDGRPDETLSTLADAPASAERETLRGAALSALRDWNAAIEAFDRAAALAPPTADLLGALGRAQFEAGRREEAVRSLERSLQIAPNQPAVRALLQRARQ